MINLIKTAMLQALAQSPYVQGLPFQLYFTDSEIDDQPTDSSPIFQLRLVSDGVSELQGYGDPLQWLQTVQMVAHFKTTRPDPSLSGLYSALLDVDTEFQIIGLRPALNELICTGLSAANRSWLVSVGDFRKVNTYGAYTGVLEAQIVVQHAFSSSE